MQKNPFPASVDKVVNWLAHFQPERRFVRMGRISRDLPVWRTASDPTTASVQRLPLIQKTARTSPPECREPRALDME